MNKTYKISNLPIKLSIDAEKSDIINGQIVYGENVFTGNVELTADQIRAIIKDNPELLEEKKGGRYFFPNRDEKYFFIDEFGNIDYGTWAHGPFDNERLLMGVYRTEAEATLARDKQKAIVVCWKWQQENAPFEPDWGDEQVKYYVIYKHCFKILDMESNYGIQSQFTLPYFKSKEDCEAFIEANKAHLELLFTK